MPRSELVKSLCASSAAGMKAFAHAAEHFAQAGRLGCGDAQGPRHPLLVQAQQLADRGRRAKHAGSAGDMPAAVVVLGKYR
jgi:hypothetical protein